MRAWAYAAILVGIVLFLAAVLAKRLSHCVFTCKSCGGAFRIPWRRALWVEHFNSDYKLSCPHCGKKGWCAAARPNEKGAR
ncbi:MAG: hypothetical protein Q4C72_08730 [Eubacteriales bacterium]|nr:hypothetical protein [Eubacteriales bacterium]